MPVKALIEPPESFMRYAGLAQLKSEGGIIHFDNGRIRDLLLPGLATITGDYPQLAKQWNGIFVSAGR
jgi:hypothetical protein